MKDHQLEYSQGSLAETVELLFKKEELHTKVIEFFPFPVQIFSLDGTSMMVNKVALDMLGIKSVESHVGKYNVFKDPIVLELGVIDQVRQVLMGKTVYLTDFNVSYQDMIRYYNVEDRNIQTISTDITCFPLKNDNGEVECFAAVFIIKKYTREEKKLDGPDNT